jgi:cytochrome c-type biogenesis protein CcmH
VREFFLALLMGCAVSLALAQAQTQSAPRQAPSTFADPVLEARVLAIAEELRCLVCQNETIAASHADLAIDLRKQIRTKLIAGQSQAQILDFMADRYGDFVLYRPRLKASTIMLWAGPFVLLLVAFIALGMNIRRRRQSTVITDLSPADAERARRLLGAASTSDVAAPAHKTKPTP